MAEATRVAELRQRADASARSVTSTPLIPAMVAAALGLYAIGRKSMVLDEAFSVAAARMPTLDLIGFLVNSEMHASPYYFVLHVWTALGTSEAMVRSLSVVFGVVAVVATFYVGRRYGVGFPAALILAVFPYFIQYEQETRPYTMSVAGSAVSTLLYLRMVDLPRLARTGAYLAAAALMIYIHPLAALVIVSHGLHYLVMARVGLRRVVLAFAPVAIAWLPMIAFGLTHPDKIAWILPTDLSRTVNAFIQLGGGAVLAGVMAVLVAIGMRRDLPALWLTVPVIGVLAISILVQPVLQPYYMLSILPAAAVIVARNKPAAIAVLLAVSLIGARNWYAHGIKPDWRSAAAWVAAEAQAGDGVVFAPSYMRIPFGYYARVGDPLYMAKPWSSPDIGDGPTDLAGIAARERIWLVEGHGGELPGDVVAAVTAFNVAEARDYGGNGVRVSLLQRAPPP